MKKVSPPRLATWMLENLTLGRRNEALDGDLQEEFRCGRSAAWYWRQVLSAVMIGNSREIHSHSMVLFFAIFWAMLSPAWILIVAILEKHFLFNGRILQIDWPWSVFCDFGMLLVTNLIFIWAGILLYLISHLWITGKVKVRILRRGILASIPVIFVIWVALLIFPKQFLQNQQVVRPTEIALHSYALAGMASPGFTQRPVEISTSYKNPCRVIGDAGKLAMLVRLPFFLCVLCALWGTTSRSSMDHMNSI